MMLGAGESPNSVNDTIILGDDHSAAKPKPRGGPLRHLDLAKNVFQVHGVDAEGTVVVRRKLRRTQVREFFVKLAPCLIGMKACGTAHFWARELIAMGHQVKIMPPSYVKAYVRRGKNDAADAAAICEAVMRPHMRFVPVKTEEQQAALMLHKTRELLVRQQTMLVNARTCKSRWVGETVAVGPGTAPLQGGTMNRADDIGRGYSHVAPSGARKSKDLRSDPGE